MLNIGVKRLQHLLPGTPDDVTALQTTHRYQSNKVKATVLVDGLTVWLAAEQIAATTERPARIQLNLSMSEDSPLIWPAWLSFRLLSSSEMVLQVGNQYIRLPRPAINSLVYPRLRAVYTLIQEQVYDTIPVFFADDGRVSCNIRIASFNERELHQAVALVHMFVSSAKAFLNEIPQTEWAFWWQVCELNTMTHTMYRRALVWLITETPLDPDVDELWFKCLRVMEPQACIHAITALPESAQQQVWKRDLSLERWMELAMAAQQEEPSSEIAQACLAQCVSRLELTTLDTQVPKNYSPLYLPLLQHYWAHNVKKRGRVLAMTQSWLSSMNGNALLSLIIMVINDEPALCTLELVNSLKKYWSRLLTSARESFARAMMKLLERYPHYVADADWLNIYFQIFPHLNAIDTPIFRDTFIEHAPTALYGNLRNALTLPKIKTSYAANIMTLWLDTLTDQQGGAITLSEEAGPQGALSEVQQSGSLKIVDSKDHK